MRKSADLALAFGVTLKKWRVARGLSQAELALASKTDRTFISMLERGLRQPTLSTIFALARALKVSPDELVRQTQEKHKTKRPVRRFIPSAKRL